MSPMHDFNMVPVDWERDLLPEHLWIESLSHKYAPRIWLDLYHRFLDALDPFNPRIEPLVGFISDFGLIPATKREEFLEKNSDLVREAFHIPFGRIITLYPDAPCHWLVQKRFLDIERPVDPDVELNKLSKAVVRLMPGKDDYAGHLRTIPFTRMLKHGKVHFMRDQEIVKLLPKYPTQCTDEEKYHVQSFVRSTMNTIFFSDKSHSSIWPEYFWRRNLDLVHCAPYRIGMAENKELDEGALEPFYEKLRGNVDNVLGYLEEVGRSYKYDLYDTDKDDSLLGLFSRLTRLYITFLASPQLWRRDNAAIFIRCIADTAISFSYLCKKGTDKEFKSFKAYGEGKEKLLMLHLQDTYPESRSFEGMSFEDIAKERRWGFTPELMDIELSNWTEKSVRTLAGECGLEDVYKLVYDPASADLHGTWISLEKTNFFRCIQPLHRFHRLPGYIEPPIAVNALTVVQDLYFRAQKIGREILRFPAMKTELNPVDILSIIFKKDDRGEDTEPSTAG